MLDSRRAVFVISGTQGAGKTTVASLLARRFERGVHVSADTLQKMIVSGAEWPVASQTTINTPDVEVKPYGNCGFACTICAWSGGRSSKRVSRSCSTTSWSEGGSTTCERISPGMDFMFVMLTPSIATVRDRERQRGTVLWRDWEWLTEEVLDAAPGIGLWLDSSRQSADETVDEIMRRAWDEALVHG